MAHVLVVDDDDANRDTARILLEDAEHTVSEAKNGLAAIAQLRNATSPLVVLLDYRLPGMDGLDVLRVVARDDALARRHAFVLVTAWDFKQLRLALPDTLAHLITAIIVKPYDIRTLLETVAAAARQLPPRETERMQIQEPGQCKEGVLEGEAME